MEENTNYDYEHTSIEQSKQLMEYGMPLNTADCMIDEKFPEVIIVLSKKNCYTEAKELFKTSLPCWSIGRLIKLHLACNTEWPNPNDKHLIFSELTDFNGFIDMIIQQVHNNKYDFSKFKNN